MVTKVLITGQWTSRLRLFCNPLVLVAVRWPGLEEGGFLQWLCRNCVSARVAVSFWLQNGGAETSLGVKSLCKYLISHT